MSDDDEERGGNLVKRRPGVTILLSIVTFGIYFLYWYYSVNKQCRAELDGEFSPVIRTVGLFVPVYNFLVIWRTSKSVGAVVGDRDELALFMSMIQFAPAFIGVTQADFNAVADGRE